jgi:acetyl-CoA carboxylase carboxyltransferase component
MAASSRMRILVDEVRALEDRLREGGGPKRIERQHAQGKLTARERIDRLIDPGGGFLEIGLLLAYDLYEGNAPGVGVVTGVGEVGGRPVVIVANDATVKAGSWWPETIPKKLRAQEIAMRCRVPIIYLVDSSGINLPYQGGVFPGKYGASRLFYYNSIMRHYLDVPQIAAVMGPCIAGGAYLPALSDVIVMVDGSSFMGLGGPNLVKGATGQDVEAEVLGGASTHNRISGVAHYEVPDDEACISRIRDLVADLPPARLPPPVDEPKPPARSAEQAYDLIPPDHRQPYEMESLLETFLDADHFDEFQAGYAPEMITAVGRLNGRRVGVISNRRGLLFVQDVSGFMVGTEAEHSGIIRAGAMMVESMSVARVPKIVLTIGHASGAGYYAMAGQGFDPDFIFTWPTGRMGVMEGESAVRAVHGPKIDRAAAEGAPLDEETQAAIEGTRAEYERDLDARYAAARGYVDAIIAPEETRDVLDLALRTALENPAPHIGPFTLADDA